MCVDLTDSPRTGPRRSEARQALAQSYRSALQTWDRCRFWWRRNISVLPAARRRFAAQLSVLSDVQQRIVDDLRATGLAQVHVGELLADEAPLREDLHLAAERFASSPAVDRAREEVSAGQQRSTSKQYIVKCYDGVRDRRWDDPLIRFAALPDLLDVVNTYLGWRSKCLSADFWYTIPRGAAAVRTQSQNWHRDYEDRQLVKVFLFLRDVDEENGPLEYIPGSRRGGPYASLAPPPTGTPGLARHYPSPDRVDQIVPAADRVTCCVPAGTVVLCDTSGLHRGGYAVSGERLHAVWTFVSPAAIAPRQFQVVGGIDSCGTSETARFALG